uniref:SHSP domain-containing protein n=1 Tax=Kalanchoe fedtschenkoi TaxID=63787 RepID=A0A7N0V236_KALFE
MDLGFVGFDEHPLFSSLRHVPDGGADEKHATNTPTQAYGRQSHGGNAADIIENPKSYVFIIDMPGLKSGDIKVQVENENVLEEGVKYVRMERWGKFMRKFTLQENANTDGITAVVQDGVLTVTVEKLPPPEPKKPKTIEVKIG